MIQEVTNFVVFESLRLINTTGWTHLETEILYLSQILVSVKSLAKLQWEQDLAPNPQSRYSIGSSYAGFPLVTSLVT